MMMTNGFFWLLITLVSTGGGFVAMVVDAPKTQFICLCGAVASLLVTLHIEQRSG
jgi:hypothetical protein